MVKFSLFHILQLTTCRKENRGWAVPRKGQRGFSKGLSRACAFKVVTPTEIDNDKYYRDDLAHTLNVHASPVCDYKLKSVTENRKDRRIDVQTLRPFPRKKMKREYRKHGNKPTSPRTVKSMGKVCFNLVPNIYDSGNLPEQYDSRAIVITSMRRATPKELSTAQEENLSKHIRCIYMLLVRMCICIVAQETETYNRG